MSVLVFAIVGGASITVWALTRPTKRWIYAHQAIPGGEVVLLMRNNENHRHWWSIADRTGQRLEAELFERRVMFSSYANGVAADTKSLYLVEARQESGDLFFTGREPRMTAYDRENGAVRWSTSLEFSPDTIAAAPTMQFVQVLGTQVFVALMELRRPDSFVGLDLLSLDARSGALLWHERLPPCANEYSRILVFGSKAILVSLGQSLNGLTLRVLDPQTGRTVRDTEIQASPSEPIVFEGEVLAWISGGLPNPCILNIMSVNRSESIQRLPLPHDESSLCSMHNLLGRFRGNWIVRAELMSVSERTANPTDAAEDSFTVHWSDSIYGIDATSGRLRFSIPIPHGFFRESTSLNLFSSAMLGDLPRRMSIDLSIDGTVRTVVVDLLEGTAIGNYPGRESPMAENPIGGGAMIAYWFDSIALVDQAGVAHGFEKLSSAKEPILGHVADGLWWVADSSSTEPVPADALRWAAVDIRDGRIVVRHGDVVISEKPSVLGRLGPALR